MKKMYTHIISVSSNFNIMKDFIRHLGFLPKENTNGIFIKKYPLHNGYTITIDFETEKIDFGDKIIADSKTTQNFSQSENWVVLECVDRLLEKWYKPEDIVLEKVYPTGHGTSGRLDVLVKKNKKAYLMIECKTWGKEFDKEFKNICTDGGQLFTYFQQDRDTEFLVLYASNFEKGKMEYKNEIIKIEKAYRETSNVPDLYNRWNKFTKQNGIFEEWTYAYDFKSKALTLADLKDIKQKDSSFIFDRFLEILRHNTVSDKPNAFNKVFTLFLCKIYDEWCNKWSHDELKFQWKEWEDTDESFQMRLTDLYKQGMLAFLLKEISDFSQEEFENELVWLGDLAKQKILDKIIKLRLQKNNEFAIKEVFDKETFDDNAKVLKEVVELLQGYKIRYAEKQPFLWDFFELLLTTGLKQESGQFFTPVPVARFVCRSIPLDEIVASKLKNGSPTDLLPTVIDYAAWSGHFLTESMEEIQNIITNIDESTLKGDALKEVKKWKTAPFDWALEYTYGIEKDYRLVKTAKVGCYLHGDGVATVIHGDGLDSFDTEGYRWKLKGHQHDDRQDNAKFDIVISNPPYSVSAFKSNLDREKASKDFSLYDKLTDSSSEIECLFIERTKQLLKEWGIAGIILPSSILSNAGIYTRSREIILRNFEIIAITGLGSGTFMATGTNTVVLFMRRRNKYLNTHLEEGIRRFVVNMQDVALNGVENIFSKYVRNAWEWVSFDDYKTLLQKTPNEAIRSHELFKDYEKKIKLAKGENIFTKIIEREQEKMLYFVLAYPQQVVLVKSGDKDVEKEFLGYEFSNRRGNEWIHAVQRGKQIDECTKLFDPRSTENPEKASTYIRDAFNRKHDRPIDETMRNHVFRVSLVDMMTFDRGDFEKNVSLNLKKKFKGESKWEMVKLGDILSELESGNRPQWWVGNYKSGVPSLWWEHIGLDGNIELWNIKFVPVDFFNESPQWKLKDSDILICKDGALTGKIALFDKKQFNFERWMVNEHVFILRTNQKCDQKYLFHYLFSKEWQNLLKENITGQAQGWLNRGNLLNIKIPLPPLDVQERIVREIEELERREIEKKKRMESLKEKINEQLQKGTEYRPLRGFLETINPSKEIVKDVQDDTRVSFLSMPDVSNEWEVTNLQTRILKQVRSGYTFFQEWDVLFAKITPCMENGKGALVGRLENNLGFGSTEFFVLRADKTKLIPKLLFYFTKTQGFRKDATGAMTGASGHKRVPQSFIEGYDVSFPSLSDQTRIVEEIETIEAEIATIQSELTTITRQKEDVLKKYL